ncbi:MAG: selenium-dependent molybdenum cofactor biosynthesis protein YqeB [Anaerolineales bacterium]
MLVLIRGGGDLASGVAVRLHRAGFEVVIAELAQPLVVRRTVSFAEAVPEGRVEVEGITAELVNSPAEAREALKVGNLPVLVDPDLNYLEALNPEVLVDARMRKKPPERGKDLATLVIGLGPGFAAGENCHAVIETNRGHDLGRVLWAGTPQPDTGIPASVMGYSQERVLRSPADGELISGAKIGDRVKKGTVIALVANQAVLSPFDGILRGMIRPGSQVTQGMKIGDVDPRDDPNMVFLVSDKSRAIGGAVLEAILACPDLRSSLWS